MGDKTQHDEERKNEIAKTRHKKTVRHELNSVTNSSILPIQSRESQSHLGTYFKWAFLHPGYGSTRDGSTRDRFL